MKSKRLVTLIGSVCLALVLAVLPFVGACAAEKAPAPGAVYLKWGATTVRSTLVSQIISQIKTVNETYPGEIVITYVETGGFLENLVRMQKGFLDLGVSCTGASYCSYTGTLDFEDANPNLRSLGPMYQTPLNLVVTKASGITRLEDFEGRKLATLPGGTSDRHFRLMFDACDIQPDYQWMGMAAAVEAMKGGMVDGYLKAGYREAIIMDIAAGVDVTIIPATMEQIEKLQKKYPGHGLLSGEIPAGLYTFLDEPVFLLWYSPADMVDKNVPEDVVYKIIKAIYENREAIAEPLAFLKVGGYVDMWELTVESEPVPLHPGSVRFFKEQGFEIPAHLIPPEMK